MIKFLNRLLTLLNMIDVDYLNYIEIKFCAFSILFSGSSSRRKNKRLKINILQKNNDMSITIKIKRMSHIIRSIISKKKVFNI